MKYIKPEIEIVDVNFNEKIAGTINDWIDDYSSDGLDESALTAFFVWS